MANFNPGQNFIVGIFLGILALLVCGFVTLLFYAQLDAELQAFATILSGLLAASVVGWQINSAAQLERISHQRQTTTKVYNEISKCIVAAQNELNAMPHKRRLVETLADAQIADEKMKIEAVANAIKEFSNSYDLQQRKTSEIVDILIAWGPVIPVWHSIVHDLHPVRIRVINEYPKVMQELRAMQLQIYGAGTTSGHKTFAQTTFPHSEALDTSTAELHQKLVAAHSELRKLISR